MQHHYIKYCCHLKKCQHTSNYDHGSLHLMDFCTAALYTPFQCDPMDIWNNSQNLMNSEEEVVKLKVWDIEMMEQDVRPACLSSVCRLNLTEITMAYCQ